MNAIRILANGILAFICLWGGVYLLGRESFFLRDRGHPQVGILFSGVSLTLLAFALFLIAAFAAAIALAWIRGALPMPGRRVIRPHPAYQGQIIVRYWYLVVPALILIVTSVMLAKRVPNPLFQPTSQSGMAGLFFSCRPDFAGRTASSEALLHVDLLFAYRDRNVAQTDLACGFEIPVIASVAA
ncbi:MAG TPA: hypothetical protein VFN25_15815 [Dokdonella sp.]|nr:hypothetical protein [Dokdonella sp.]